jgi:hypothetical protein
MKIYAITSYNYYQNRICALTVSKEKAERLYTLYSNGRDGFFIEEYEDGDGQDLCIPWLCDENGCNPKMLIYYQKERIQTNCDGSITSLIVLAKDKAHAEKKAHDMIAEYKAKKEGIC